MPNCTIGNDVELAVADPTKTDPSLNVWTPSSTSTSLSSSTVSTTSSTSSRVHDCNDRLIADAVNEIFSEYPRLSAPLLSPDLATSVTSAETVLLHANVHILGLSWRHDHYVYMLHVDTTVERFVVHRRFAEFRQLRKDLLRLLDNQPSPSATTTRGSTTATTTSSCYSANSLCRQLQYQLKQASFPRRHLWSRDAKQCLMIAQERMTVLQHFLHALLRVYSQGSRRSVRRCIAMQCPVLQMLATFLHIPMLQMAESPTSSVPMMTPTPLLCAKEDAHVVNIPLLAADNEPVQRKSGLIGFRHARDLPPTTRVSLDVSALQQQQLFPISEDVQVLHLTERYSR